MIDIPFRANQGPSFLKQGGLPAEASDHVDPFGEKARTRTDHYLTRAEQILAGERPVMGGQNLGDKWVVDMLNDMIDAGMLPEHILAYMRKPELQYVMGLNPVPYEYIEDREALKKEMAELNIKNCRIAADRHGLFKDFRGHDMETQVESANTTIALPGELFAMKEILHIIDQKMDGQLLDHPLIIENPTDADDKGFWDQLLRGIKILNFAQANKAEPHLKREYVDFDQLACDYGIYISESRSTTLEMAKKLTPDKAPLRKLNTKPFIPDGSILFVATGTQKKYDEIAALCKAQGIQVDVRPIYELVDVYVGPVEDKRTYQGNVQAKIKAAFDAWHAMPEGKRMEALDHNGLKEKKQAFIIAEDSGFHFEEPRIAGHDLFTKISHTLDIDAPFPGVETGPSTIGSDGIMGFMKKIESIFAERKSPNYGVVKKSLIAIAPLEQERYGAMDMHIVSAETKGKVTFKPMPPPDVTGAVEIDNYLIPDVTIGGRKLTEAQMGDDFYLHHSPRALAMRGLAMEMGITIDKAKQFEQKFSPDFCAGIVVDDHSYASKIAAEAIAKIAHGEGFNVITSPSRFERPIDIQTNVLAKSDGVVFAFDPALAKQDFWRNVYLFTSMIVAEQTHDKYKLKKPFYLVNPEGAFDYLVKLVSDLHHSGTVSENPNSLYKITKSIEEAVDKLKEDRKRYRKFVLPSHSTQEEPFDYRGHEGTKDFNVAIFCSATNKNATNMGHARKITDTLIDEGFGIVSGGGMYASMGEVTDAVHQKRRKGAEHLASNAVHIMPGEGNAENYVTQFFKARNIYERMEYMIDKSDAFVIMPGGTGTIQELALLALLKKQHLELDDPYATEKMKHKEIFIVNSPMETQKDRGFYSKLKEIIDENDPESLEKLGIHFVPDQETALKEIRELREGKRARTGWKPPANGRGHRGNGAANDNGHASPVSAIIH